MSVCGECISATPTGAVAAVSTVHYATLRYITPHSKYNYTDRHAATTTIANQLRLRDTTQITLEIDYTDFITSATNTTLHSLKYSNRTTLLYLLLVHYAVRYSTEQYRTLHYTAL